MVECSSCGAAYSEDLHGCPRCAREDGAAHRCERCGEDFLDDPCPACGTLRQEVRCERHEERMAGGRCVICGRALCGACRAPAKHAHLCGEHADVPVIEGWAQVYHATSDFEALLLRDNLQAEGIDSRVYSQRDSILSLDLGELSIVRLLVPTWEFERAHDLIRQHRDAEGEVAFACAGCGEAFDPGARECTGCGASLARKDGIVEE